MATLTIRRLDAEVHERLRRQAALHGRSMEAEARAILGDATSPGVRPRVTLGEVMRRFREETGGVDLETPPRVEPARAAPLE